MRPEPVETPEADAFLEVLASCTTACANMNLQDDAWKPVDGYYDVLMGAIQEGTKAQKNTGAMCVWVKPIFTILEGEFADRDFADFFWIEPNPSEPSMALRRMCQLATCLAGREVRDPVEARSIILESEGEAINVQVYTTRSKKDPSKSYTNIRYMAVLQSTEAEEAGATEADIH